MLSRLVYCSVSGQAVCCRFFVSDIISVDKEDIYYALLIIMFLLYISLTALHINPVFPVSSLSPIYIGKITESESTLRTPFIHVAVAVSLLICEATDQRGDHDTG